MDAFKAIVLGIVQGLTEFLPVSSHGHLVIVQKFLTIPEESALAFDVCLHLGTLVAVLVYFRRDLLRMLSAALGGPMHDEERYLARWWWLLGIATAPVAIIGMLWGESLERATSSTLWLGGSYLINAILLAYAAARLRKPGRGPFDVGVGEATAIGLFQAVALIPAVSRSGSTIAGGIAVGLDAPTATRFSFLLSIPAIVAAIVGNASGMGRILAENPFPIVAGTVVAGVTGALAIEFMMRVMRVGRLGPFAIYCLLLGVVLVAMGWQQ